MSERRFPIFQGPSIPWRLIEPHAAQAERNHSQTLEHLAARGGLAPCEALAVLGDRKWHRMAYPDATLELARVLETDAVLAEREACLAAIRAEWLKQMRGATYLSDRQPGDEDILGHPTLRRLESAIRARGTKP